MAKHKAKTKKKTGTALATVPLGPEMPRMTTFDVPRMDVANYVAWGNLIKDWAKGNKPAPVDIKDLMKQCLDAGVGLSVPDYIRKLCVIRQADDTFILRLPPKKKIEESEAALQQGGLYPIPAFYTEAYGIQLKIKDTEMLNFHAKRIGDYIIRLTA